MDVRAAKRFRKTNLGYYIDKPTAVIGGYDRAITILTGPTDPRYAGASFVNDDWFKFIAGATTHRSIYITTKPVKEVSRCISYNSRLDDDIIRRFGFRELLPDLLLDYAELGEEAGTELLNDALADIAKEIFETKRESYKRIFDVITAEYEPLYNLDVTYEEQHSGTDTEGIDTATDTSRAKDGSDTYSKGGTESTAYAGSEATTYAGSEAMTYAGSEATTYAGSEAMTYAGSEATTYAGSETTADNEGSKNTTDNSTYAFNSVDPVPESKSVVNFDKSETKTFNGRSDTKAFDGRSDTKTFTDRSDTKAFNGRSDTKTFTDRSDTKAFNGRSDTTTYNTEDTTEYGSSETEALTTVTDRSYTHGEKIKTRRYGNQGITRSDELVRAEMELRKEVDFLRMVAEEVAKQLSII